MARTWRDKMEHFRSVFLLQDSNPYTFTDADVAAWIEPREFTSLVEAWVDKERTDRVVEIRTLRPRVV